MTRPIIAIRPEPGCAVTVALGEERGLQITGQPLFTISPRNWVAPNSAQIDAVLVGSANALRHSGPQLRKFLGKPLYAVGTMTAQIAREHGFAVRQAGQGGLQSLLDSLPLQPMRFLRLAGAAHIDIQLPPEMHSTLRICYASEPLPMPEALAQMVRSGALVLLHSAEAARHFAGECDRLTVPRSAITIAAFGPRIAEAAGTGWASIATAPHPSDEALLALARDLWHK